MDEEIRFIWHSFNYFSSHNINVFYVKYKGFDLQDMT
ncbi:hypothetical protein BL05299 [Bacillus licheniformis DSM 13 = ATCC 14580]|uniref:Uncharacterized protein n=1 Tax=Bacillus licheniformis (strain ATCC 14580 / DSM 13 / JCM 2505 / CCUG 7422 / NBRC 12200 / NCIMB 9375 / NCTC 10341 / NRRL NRS-1264 / Gibson 46) TaxID=279010 RepID=Q62RU3_BACLD|nr:hypothetical protein BL05299 [Bacillus licheniformis DSM 13 = ATCC 14580]